METTITTEAIKERIIELNYYLIEAFNDGDKEKVTKLKYEIDSLISIYLKK